PDRRAGYGRGAGDLWTRCAVRGAPRSGAHRRRARPRAVRPGGTHAAARRGRHGHRTLFLARMRATHVAGPAGLLPLMPRLSIIIVSYNSQRDLDACLESLTARPPATGHEIVVVDNASQDGTPQHVRQRWPGVRRLE